MQSTELKQAIEQTVLEINYLVDNCVEREWGKSPLHGFPSTLYGLVMRYSSFIDTLSVYYYGSENQTIRMAKVLIDLLDYPEIPSKVFVKMWRHSLMHQAEPSLIKTKTIDDYFEFRWLLHWTRNRTGNQQNMSFATAGYLRVLNIDLQTLFKDLEEKIEMLINDLTDAQKSRALKYFSEENKIQI